MKIFGNSTQLANTQAFYAGKVEDKTSVVLPTIMEFLVWATSIPMSAHATQWIHEAGTV